MAGAWDTLNALRLSWGCFWGCRLCQGWDRASRCWCKGVSSQTKSWFGLRVGSLQHAERARSYPSARKTAKKEPRPLQAFGNISLLFLSPTDGKKGNHGVPLMFSWTKDAGGKKDLTGAGIASAHLTAPQPPSSIHAPPCYGVELHKTSVQEQKHQLRSRSVYPLLQLQTRVSAQLQGRCARREPARHTASQQNSHSLANLPVQGLSELQVASLDFSSMNLQSFSEMPYLPRASTIQQWGVPQLSIALHMGTSLITLACVPSVFFGDLQVLHGKRMWTSNL